MSFLAHSDEHGWLQSFTRDFSPAGASPTSSRSWAAKRCEAYRFTHRREVEELKLPHVAILEERET